MPYQPQIERVGGSWGDIAIIEAFEDASCTQHQAFITRTGAEVGFCTPLSDLGCGNGDVGNPCFWNSVKGHEPARLGSMK